MELLVATLVMSITVAALLNSLIESSSVSVQQRSGATVDSVLRSFAESATYQIQLKGASAASGPAYTACATSASYQLLGPPTPSTGPAGTAVTMFATGLHPGATISQVVLTDPSGATTNVPLSPVPSADPNGDATITFIVPSGLSANGSYSASISDSAGDSATSNDDFVFTSGPSSSASSPLAQYHLQVASVAWWVGSDGRFESPPGTQAPPGLSPWARGPTPANCVLNNDDSEEQVLTLTATAQDGATGTLSFVVTDPGSEQPHMTSSDRSTYTFLAGGSSESFNVTATGYPAPTITESGTLPTGVGFASGTTGVLSGNPSPVTVPNGHYVYPITFTASSKAGSYSWPATVVVNQAASIIGPAADTFIAGSSNNFPVVVTGYPAPNITESGGLPTGVGFASGTNGVLSGDPAVVTAPGGQFVYPVTFTATNAYGTSNQNFTLTVDQAPQFLSSSTTFTAGTVNSYTLTVVANPSRTRFSVAQPPTPSAPWLKLIGSRLTGTPPAGTTGNFVIGIQATNQMGSQTGKTTEQFTVTVT